MKGSLPILIFECANAHGGDIDRLRNTIQKFAGIDYANRHIKFQPLHPDAIALPDFGAYGIYQKLLLTQAEWRGVLDLATQGFPAGIWLDIFDRYGVEVLAANNDRIFGIKLQASVLQNHEVSAALREQGLLKGKILMLNVSGHSTIQIEQLISFFSPMEMKEIVLQIGHQAYPTALKDTGLQKLAVLKESFPSHRVCIADHVEAGTDMACIVPLLGIAAGCELVEKHICLERATSPYDHSAALEYSEMELLAARIIQTADVVNGPFISESEREYLAKSIQVPVAAYRLPKGSLVSSQDLRFRRTAQTGDHFEVLMQEQGKFFVLNEDIGENKTLRASQFKKARIGVLVACRMKSTRLRNKALLPIGGLPSVEFCLQQCLEIKEAGKVILTTSTEQEDAVLSGYTLNGRAAFWQGDPDDVMQRYIDACEAHGIDVVIRVTGDCPFISDEIASILLKHHFATGADYTAARESAVGTACEIYNTEVLRRVVSYTGRAEYSEYMTWYMQNNRDLFKVEIVNLPPELVRNYRLTLDYQEDLDMFNALVDQLKQEGAKIDIRSVFEVLDAHPGIANMNAHLTLKYKTDPALIEELNRKTRIVR